MHIAAESISQENWGTAQGVLAHLKRVSIALNNKAAYKLGPTFCRRLGQDGVKTWSIVKSSNLFGQVVSQGQIVSR